MIARDFDTDQPERRLVGDTTYPATGEGWLYPATRMAIGWQMTDRMRTSWRSTRWIRLSRPVNSGPTRFVPIAALNTHRRPYLLVCWDNAVDESLFASLKNECDHQQAFTTRAEARLAMTDYIGFTGIL